MNIIGCDGVPGQPHQCRPTSFCCSSKPGACTPDDGGRPIPKDDSSQSGEHVGPPHHHRKPMGLVSRLKYTPTQCISSLDPPQREERERERDVGMMIFHIDTSYDNALRLLTGCLALPGAPRHPRHLALLYSDIDPRNQPSSAMHQGHTPVPRLGLAATHHAARTHHCALTARGNNRD